MTDHTSHIFVDAGITYGARGYCLGCSHCRFVLLDWLISLVPSLFRCLSWVLRNKLRMLRLVI